MLDGSENTLRLGGCFENMEMQLQNRWLRILQIAWVILTLFSLGVFLAGLVLGGGVGLTVERDAVRQAGISLSFFDLFRFARVCVFAFVYVTAGLILFWRKSSDAIAIATSLMLITFGTTVFLNTPLALAKAYPIWQAPILLVTALGNVLNGYVFYTFPNGRFTPRWISGLLALWAVWNISHLIPSLKTAFAAQFNIIDPLLGIFFLLSFVGVQVYRYFHLYDNLQRQQTKWVALGITMSLIGFIVFRVSPWPFDHPQVYKDLVYVTGGSLFMLLIPISISIAVLRYRLWDIDPILNRALVYGALSFLTIAFYVLVVGGFAWYFRNNETNVVISFIATGIVAILFEPLRERLQRAVNRLMYGERDDPATVLMRLSQRLDSALAPDSVLQTIVETLAQTLRLPYAAISLTDDKTRFNSTSSLPPSEIISFPLTYQTERVGELILAPRAAGESFSAADMKLIQLIAQQAGVAAYTVRLNNDLKKSRERLVTAQEEERRRLRRDLHDGVGPTLASFTQRLETAAELIHTNPQKSEQMIHALQNQVTETVAEIRRLVYALRPPVLDEFGLVSAIREHTAQYSGPHGMTTTFDVTEPMPSLPAAVEVAAYRIALEAFTNVVRHANASECRIRLKVENEALLVEVSDNGKGIPTENRAGVGLTSMRERASELGGVFSVEKNLNGGTTIRASLPILESVSLLTDLDKEEM